MEGYYVVMVALDPDHDYIEEYSGVHHKTREGARAEYLRARKDVFVAPFGVWIERKGV